MFLVNPLAGNSGGEKYYDEIKTQLVKYAINSEVYISKKPGDILNIFKDKIASFKRPKEILFLNELPRNAMGKVQIEHLKKLSSSL